jgi:hypothetical protein
MPKYTAGPWTENACEVQAPDGSPICEMLSRPEDPGANYPYSPEADANSRLICAAPELLDALITTLDLAVGHACDSRGIRPAECEDWEWVKQARKLIAKVNGGE